MAAVDPRVDALAELAVRFGANVQPGQVVGISTFTGREPLTRAVVRAAYQAGARWVDVLTFDDLAKRERLLHAPGDSLEFVPPWLAQRFLWLSDEHAARIGFSGPQDPTALEGIDADRVGRDMLPWIPEVGPVVNARTTNWSAVPAPTAPWARLVHPDLPEGEALERLWQAVVHVCRLDEPDPVAAWETRFEVMLGAAARLTARRFDAIRLHGPGTDLTIGLLPGSRWNAARFETVDGLVHHPNLPTEEVFTTPDPQRAEGHVTMTLPLEQAGAIVEGIRIEFRGGEAVRIDADRNAEVIRAVAARDEGARRLGELALVDGGGRIGPLRTVFYDTLLDENAASHIALGNGLAMAVEGDDVARINASGVHVDMMIGSPELDVDGLDGDGTATPVLRNGAWQI